MQSGMHWIYNMGSPDEDLYEDVIPDLCVDFLDDVKKMPTTDWK